MLNLIINIVLNLKQLEYTWFRVQILILENVILSMLGTLIPLSSEIEYVDYNSIMYFLIIQNCERNNYTLIF
jgi:hypothetical protein